MVAYIALFASHMFSQTEANNSHIIIEYFRRIEFNLIQLDLDCQYIRSIVSQWLNS